MSHPTPASIFRPSDGGLCVNTADFTDPTARYQLLIQSYVPRPIAWVLTENESGSYNLAPFSYSAVVDHSPPTLMFSCGMRREDRSKKKDTWANLLRTGHCVVHIPSVANIEAVNNSGAPLPHGTSEVDAFNIPTTPFEGFPLPRVTAAPVAYACSLKEAVELGSVPMGLMLVTIEKFFVTSGAVTGQEGELLHLDESKIDPLTRLGKTKYGTLGKLLDIGHPPRA